MRPFFEPHPPHAELAASLADSADYGISWDIMGKTGRQTFGQAKMDAWRMG
jgi:hypothetical protein